jgi:kynurenine formamidase
MKSYAELLARTDAPAGSAWGLHGASDEVGTLNFLGPEKLVMAAKLVRKGRVFNLDRPLNAFRLPYRPTLKHVILGGKQHHTRDDYLDGFYLQSGTQLDGLRHVKHPDHGFYNGATDDDVVADTMRLGIQRYAEHGIAGRGVLLDVDSHLRARGKPLNQEAGDAFSVQLLDEVAAAQKVRFTPGDILLIRTGWLHAYFKEMSQERRESLAKRMISPGLIQAHESVAWLWDHQFAVCAADNPGLEVLPAHPSSPFTALLAHRPEIKPYAAATMHPLLIPLLGLCIGELWDLDALADDCRQDGVYEFMVTAKPLNLIGGVGSPANAMAIK